MKEIQTDFIQDAEQIAVLDNKIRKNYKKVWATAVPVAAAALGLCIYKEKVINFIAHMEVLQLPHASAESVFQWTACTGVVGEFAYVAWKMFQNNTMDGRKTSALDRLERQEGPGF